ncbi:MAG TPA: hypothetical protein VEA38_12170 [Terriglobales bacterium]|nr:hypothetical protein [Terriglobales bacterium]
MTKERPAPTKTDKQPVAMTIAAAAVVEIPFRPSSAFLMHRVDGRLDVPQARTLRCVMDALLQSGATLADGHPVQRPLDVFRWFLERAAADMPAEIWTAPPPVL